MAMKAKYEKMNSDEQCESVYICIDETDQETNGGYGSLCYEDTKTGQKNSISASCENLCKSEPNEHTKLYIKPNQTSKKHTVMDFVKKFLSVMYATVLRFRNSTSDEQRERHMNKEKVSSSSRGKHLPSATEVPSLISQGAAVKKYLQLHNLQLATSTSTFTSNISPGFPEHETKRAPLLHSQSTPSIFEDLESATTKLKSKSFSELDKIHKEETPLKYTQGVNYSTNQSTAVPIYLNLGMRTKSGTLDLPASPSYSYISWATLGPVDGDIEDMKYCRRVWYLNLALGISYIMFLVAFILSIILVVTIKRDYGNEFRNGGMFG